MHFTRRSQIIQNIEDTGARELGRASSPARTEDPVGLRETLQLILDP